MSGDAAELPTTTSPSEPTGPVASATTDAPESSVAATPETVTTIESTAAASDEQYQKWLTERDPDEVIRLHPRLAGKIGELAEKQARKKTQELRAQWEAERAQEQAEHERNRQIEEARQARAELEADPFAAAPKVKAILDGQLANADKAEADRKRQIEEAGRQNELMAVVRGFQDELPETIRNDIAGKAYPGTWQEGYKAYLQEVNERLAEHRYRERYEKDLATARVRWEREALPALRKDVLSEVNGHEPTPELSNGAATNGVIDQSVWDANRGNRAWLKANRAEWQRAIAQGVIRY